MTNMKPQVRVMIAGIGGASLGTEIGKCLCLAGKYQVYGCDISPTAYGLYDKNFTKTYHINKNNYVAEVLNASLESGAKYLIPGGEQPNAFLGAAQEVFLNEGIHVITNKPSIVSLFSDKDATFNKLQEYGIAIPKTTELKAEDDLNFIGLPCIVKPSTGSGGSASVFFAVTADEAMIYADFIRRNGSSPIAQEYVSDDVGEFTVGVLSLPDSTLVGSIALRRVFDAKLSVAYRGRGGLVSSGYSQGYIDDFPKLRRQAEEIAKAIGSSGPINIQGRVRDGVFLPFEINPRFSASTYLRALAGFNEIDILLSYMEDGSFPQTNPIKPGWYLRSLTETFIASGDVV